MASVRHDKEGVMGSARPWYMDMMSLVNYGKYHSKKNLVAPGTLWKMDSIIPDQPWKNVRYTMEKRPDGTR